MSIEDQFDREEQNIHDRYDRGEITLKQLQDELRELRAEYREAARESAQNAYDREMERW